MLFSINKILILFKMSRMNLQYKKKYSRILYLIVFSLLHHFAFAQQVVPYKDDFFVLKNFKFSDGASLDSIKLHYYYVGKPHLDKQGNVDNAILIMHGTGGSGENFLTENFAGQLFKAGQVLDAIKYFIILTDAIGHGKSRMAFLKMNPY
jgi:homoserine O-acetyltransferase